MKYRESHLDRNLRRWFSKDNSHALLKSINLKEGAIRGLSPFKVEFGFPITAVAGKNGSGKSTLLALACCAYHNHQKGFKLPNRKANYYTFADFFIQHSEDIPPEGIEIFYGIAHNRWRKSDHVPDGEGTAFQKRWKKKGGKWNDYAGRVNRDVVFLGIERIVPHNEKSQSKSYSKAFSDSAEKGWEDKVKDVVGKIIGKKYESFKYVSHSKYRLPIVKVNGKSYSGFNMGAGENALFEVFSIVHAVSEGSLIVIDEIELGLHSEAQKKFIQELKSICKKRNLQIICTTHSKDIFDQLPDDARIYIDSANHKSYISDSISSEYAFSKLSATNSEELLVIVEDNVAKSIIQAVLPNSHRSRIKIEVIGSASALSRQLAANYCRDKREHIFSIFDGDQKVKEKNNLKLAISMTESTDKEDDIRGFLLDQISYLPGETWPESWLVKKCAETLDALSEAFNIGEDEMRDIIEGGLEAGKHNEFFDISEHVGLSEEATLTRFCLILSRYHKDDFTQLIEKITEKLKG
jgi:AAA15 family ATPase/GTPase